MKKKICKNCLHYNSKQCVARNMDVTKTQRGCALFQRCINLDATITTFLIIDTLDLIATIAFLIYYFWR